MTTSHSDFTTSFEVERHRFARLVGDRLIGTIGWRIAIESWFSWRELYRQMHSISKDHRVHSMRYLKACKAERKNHAQRNPLKSMRDRNTNPLVFFDMPICKFSYMTGCFKIMLGKGRIGLTMNFERRKGNIVRVYYKSDLNMAIDFVLIDVEIRDKDLWQYLGEEPLFIPSYQVSIRKSVAG